MYFGDIYGFSLYGRIPSVDLTKIGKQLWLDRKTISQSPLRYYLATQRFSSFFTNSRMFRRHSSIPVARQISLRPQNLLNTQSRLDPNTKNVYDKITMCYQSRVQIFKTLRPHFSGITGLLHLGGLPFPRNIWGKNT